MIFLLEPLSTFLISTQFPLSFTPSFWERNKVFLLIVFFLFTTSSFIFCKITMERERESEREKERERYARKFYRAAISVVKCFNIEYLILLSITRLFLTMDFYFGLVAIFLIFDVISVRSTGKKNSQSFQVLFITRDLFCGLFYVIKFRYRYCCDLFVNIIKSKRNPCIF